ncbi:MAG: hypothetical protein IV090_24620 [Candidatus Sericytochromatia bacterium]|nr:hypothetical protein [Candidatus Sericytochromatia bacterium]
MRQNLRWLASVELVIGILGESAYYQNGEGFSLVDIAIVNEFGSDDGRIPERAAHRTTFREQKAAMLRRMNGVIRLTIDGKSPSQALDKLGLYYTAKLRAQIIAWSIPANAPATIAKKGADNPLIDTGRTLNATQHKVRKK